MKNPIKILVTVLLHAFAFQGMCEVSSLKDAYQDHFQVGTAVNRSLVTRTPGRRSLELTDKDIELLKKHFNQISPENDLKWQLVHPREGAEGYDFKGADAFVNYGVSNNLMVAGHTLVWHSQTPDWVFRGTNVVTTTNSPAPAGPGGWGGYSGPRASREELLLRMRDHIHTVVGRYKGKIKVWDVVNEALADGGGTNVFRDTLWLKIIGPDFIAKAFQYAHEADPDALLRYNDYGLENPNKRAKLLILIKSLQDQKIPIHVIGTQTHVNTSITFETIDQTLKDIDTLGLPIHVTEFDVNGSRGGQGGFGADVSANATATQGGLVNDADQKLAAAYAGIFRAFLKHPSLKLVTFWGLNDTLSWRAAGKPLLFDGNDQPKPAFDAVMAEVKKAPSAK